MPNPASPPVSVVNCGPAGGADPAQQVVRRRRRPSGCPGPAAMPCGAAGRSVTLAVAAPRPWSWPGWRCRRSRPTTCGRRRPARSRARWRRDRDVVEGGNGGGGVHPDHAVGVGRPHVAGAVGGHVDRAAADLAAAVGGHARVRVRRIDLEHAAVDAQPEGVARRGQGGHGLGARGVELGDRAVGGDPAELLVGRGAGEPNQAAPSGPVVICTGWPDGVKVPSWAGAADAAPGRAAVRAAATAKDFRWWRGAAFRVSLVAFDQLRPPGPPPP